MKKFARKDLFEEKQIIFHQGNVPAHETLLPIEKLRDLRYDFLGHPPYHPDFITLPSLPTPNKGVSGKRYASNEQVERTENKYFNSLPDSYCPEGILIIQKR